MDREVERRRGDVAPERDERGRRPGIRQRGDERAVERAPERAVPGAGRAADALAALGDEGEVRRAGPPLAVDARRART